MPGVVGHTSDMFKHSRLIADRLIRHANLVGRENVIAGTDCGLAPASATPKSSGKSSRPWPKAPGWRPLSSGASSPEPVPHVSPTTLSVSLMTGVGPQSADVTRPGPADRQEEAG
jgi:hypothetical protein